jgi:hypothetical protein
MWKEVVVVYFKVISSYFHGGTEETHENPYSVWSPSQPRFEPDTSQLSVQLFIFFIYYLVCETIGTAATPGLLCQHRVKVRMIVEKQMECRLAVETEVLGENLPQRHFCPSQNFT